MRRRQRRSAQLTFVMEFPAGEVTSSSSSTGSGSLWSQIHARSSPHQHQPHHHPLPTQAAMHPSQAAQYINNNENGFPGAGGGGGAIGYLQHPSAAAAAGAQHHPQQPGQVVVGNRVMVMCHQWLMSMSAYCTSCVPRQRVYGMSAQENRFTGANAPNTQQSRRRRLEPSAAPSGSSRVIVAEERFSNYDDRPGMGSHVSQQPYPMAYNDGSNSQPYQTHLPQQQQQQQPQYRFSGASAPARPGYEQQLDHRHHGSSNSDSPPYLPSREHQGAGGGGGHGGWNANGSSMYDDRPV